MSLKRSIFLLGQAYRLNQDFLRVVFDDGRSSLEFPHPKAARAWARGKDVYRLGARLETFEGRSVSWSALLRFLSASAPRVCWRHDPVPGTGVGASRFHGADGCLPRIHAARRQHLAWRDARREAGLPPRDARPFEKSLSSAWDDTPPREYVHNWKRHRPHQWKAR